MFAIEERYRSGHNGAASKADGRKPRGFESHPLRIFILKCLGARFSGSEFLLASLLVGCYAWLVLEISVMKRLLFNWMDNHGYARWLLALFILLFCADDELEIRVAVHG